MQQESSTRVPVYVHLYVSVSGKATLSRLSESLMQMRGLLQMVL